VSDVKLINYEANSSFTLTVEVTDNGSPAMSNVADVTVNIRDLNEAPVVIDQAFAIDENSAAGTDVGTVLASDEDIGQVLTYAIVGGNESGAFAIDPATGRITVANAALLNFEANPSFTLTVEVTDNGSPVLSDSATVTVTVNDLDETHLNRPPVVEDQVLWVDENTAAGTVVGVVAAGDPDIGQVLTYAIVSGNESGAFAIDAMTGEITVANAALMNFEANPTFTLTVEVTDNGVPSFSDSALVTVSLTNVNEAPVLDTRGSVSLAPVNRGAVNNPGTLVSDLLTSSGRPRVTDPDAGALQGIAVIAADTRHGSWQFSTDGGATWQNLGTVSNTSARLLAADARIRFVPAGNYHGTLSRGITFRAWDQTSGTNGGVGDTSINGGSSAFSTALDTASIRVRSATEQILLLAIEVHDLRQADVLTSSQSYDLQSKLVGAVKKMVCGDAFAATCHLEEFIARVREFAAAGVLTQGVCDDLCARAEAIIDSLS
jgi:hypothetical protein